LKSYIIWWHDSNGGITFAKDVDKNVQLFTKEEADGHLLNNPNVHIEKVGVVNAVWTQR
jgi:hypothetical protein